LVFGIISVKLSDFASKVSVNPNPRLKSWENYQIFIHDTHLPGPDSKLRLLKRTQQ